LLIRWFRRLLFRDRALGASDRFGDIWLARVGPVDPRPTIGYARIRARGRVDAPAVVGTLCIGTCPTCWQRYEPCIRRQPRLRLGRPDRIRLPAAARVDECYGDEALVGTERGSAVQRTIAFAQKHPPAEAGSDRRDRRTAQVAGNSVPRDRRRPTAVSRPMAVPRKRSFPGAFEKLRPRTWVFRRRGCATWHTCRSDESVRLIE